MLQTPWLVGSMSHQYSFSWSHTDDTWTHPLTLQTWLTFVLVWLLVTFYAKVAGCMTFNHLVLHLLGLEAHISTNFVLCIEAWQSHWLTSWTQAVRTASPSGRRSNCHAHLPCHLAHGSSTFHFTFAVCFFTYCDSCLEEADAQSNQLDIIWVF